LIVFGIILAACGVFLAVAGKLPLFGKLPGDILIQKKNFTFYFPLVTCVILSLIFSLIFWLWQRR
jgi:hypothetical protein